jgi:O-antigen ligase
MRSLTTFLTGAVAAALLTQALGAWTWLAIALLAAAVVVLWLSAGDVAARLAAVFMLGFCAIAPALWPEDFDDPAEQAALADDRRAARAVLSGRDR